MGKEQRKVILQNIIWNKAGEHELWFNNANAGLLLKLSII